MEELNSSPKPKRWHGWIKPIAFTTLLYVSLAGVVYCSYGTKKTDSPSNSVVPKPVASTIQSTAVSSSHTADAVLLPQEAHTNPSNEQAAPQLPPPPQPTKPVADPAQNTAISQLPPPQPAPQNEPPLPQPDLAPAVPPPTPPKNNPKAKAMSSAEAEAEAQNEILRQAIEKVKAINDNKISKSREEMTESSVPAYPSIIKDDEKNIQIDESQEDSE